jgi:hypothetical protein
MLYPRSFFALQLAFAQRIASRFSLPLTDALRHHTTFAVSLKVEDTWENFAQAFVLANDPLELTYQLYAERSADEHIPKPDDTLFLGRPLFGCFYYVVRDTTIINPHFINNDLPGLRPLSQARQPARRDELRRMFMHIRETLPTVTTVSGHSWLYNLPAYTRLFPPDYTRDMVENPDGVLNQMVLWYQCYDRFWEVKPAIAEELLRRVERATNLTDLRLCFPYQRFRTRAPIADFYEYYAIDG